MDRNPPTDRTTSRRRPLLDTTARVNNSPTPAQLDQILTASPQLPHHESLKVEGNLTTRGNPGSPIAPAGNKRISAIANESQPNSNRNSAISTTSTASGGKSGRPRKTHVGPWQLGKTLGKGATGRVRLAKHALTGQAAAVKIVSKKSAALVQSASMAQLDKDVEPAQSSAGYRLMPFGIEREVVIMKLIEHPNVINLYDVWENRGELYLVLEYVEGGELFEYVSEVRLLPEEEAVRLFRQIISGLSYCHRFNICHRDLKPENILLDSEGNIKLADFGMAALQPAGHWLNTSCGSPHYAAPEIIYGKRYRGDKADIWSCGIILYAMLTGRLPFDGEDLSSTLKLVKQGEYYLPPELSAEAQDLIQRILQKRPEKRISMSHIWSHPLLRKYEKYHLSISPNGALPGPPPPLSMKDCGRPVSKRSDIDGEILRNLRTLWHGAKQDEIVEKLLNVEPNHEKMFYTALTKFREEQLENYPGVPLEYSASDYHHIGKPIQRSATKRQLHSQTHSRRKSQFSIVSDEPRRRGTPEKGAGSVLTEGSYDPYRSSRTPVTEAEAEYATIIRHHPSDTSSGQQLTQARSAQHPAISRLQSAEPGQGSPSPQAVPGSNKRSQRTSASRSSLASSRRRTSVTGVRTSSSYKRNVSFQHIRQRSISHPAVNSGHHAQFSFDQGHPSRPSSKHGLQTHPTHQRHSSASLAAPAPAPVPTVTIQELVLQKPRVQSHYWKDDARKVSNELGKICEEAFNRSSISSSATAATPSHDRTTSKTSASKSHHPTSSKSDGTGSRPLPRPPKESLNSYTLRELAETRRRLIEHCKREGSGEMGDYLVDVIAHLDQLMLPNAERSAENGERRVASDPVASGLPSISEEDQGHGKDSKRSRTQPSSSHRATSDPVPGKVQIAKTIRLVEPEALPTLETIRPLNIRKKSDSSPGQSLHVKSDESLRSKGLLSFPADENIHRPSSLGSRRDSGFEGRYYGGLDTIEENPKSPKQIGVASSGDNKKKSWFKRNVHTPDTIPPTPPRKDTPTSLEQIGSHGSNGSKTRPSGSHGQQEEKRASADGGKKWFTKIFGKGKFDDHVAEQPTHKIVNDSTDPEESADSLNNSSENIRPDLIGRPSQRPPAPNRNIQVNQNWFAKFFHIQPAMRIMCMNVSRPKARREIAKVLKEWKKYGLKDVAVDKAGNLIFGRVDEINYLKLKPVSFAGEIYRVVEYGHRANLSIVRFTQERGAASSFYKVMETLQLTLRERNFLVDDSARARKMARELEKSAV